ncbi:MAG: ketopantoate reductase family protein [Chloroflexi bacterium]|nr:ketopantoate reductase family protein [Chloroflexota bacterium]
MGADRSIAVYGAGAVGCYLGGQLSWGGESEVTLIGRTPLVEAVQSHGLTIREDGAERVSHPRATTSIAGLPACDLAILAVRAYDVERSIPELAALMGESGLCLAVQNGVGSEEQLAGALDRRRVLVGTLTARTDVEAPGVVARASRGGGVALASMDGSPVPRWIVDAFRAAWLPTMVLLDYRSLRWSKLLLSMLGAAQTAILDVDLAAVVGNPALFRLEQLAFREAGRVMDAQRIPTAALPGYPVPLARLAMRLPRSLARRLLRGRLAGSRGGRAPTMRADVARGRSEIAYLNGAVAREGGRLGVRTPVNRGLADLVEELVAHPGRRDTFRGRPDALLAFMAGRGIRV